MATESKTSNRGGERKGSGRKKLGNVKCNIELNRDLLTELRHFATLANLSQVNAHNIVTKAGLDVEIPKLKRGKK
jgi:hypothetical protein